MKIGKKKQNEMKMDEWMKKKLNRLSSIDQQQIGN